MIEYSREHAGIPLPNEEFAKKLSVVWEESFKPKNLRSGFESTGLLPVNPEKFPTTAYDQLKLKRFVEYTKNKEKIQQTTTEIPMKNPEQQPCTSTSTIPEQQPCMSTSTANKKQNRPTGTTKKTPTKNIPSPTKTVTPCKISPFETFIREKLSETKDSDVKTQPSKRKRLTFDVGSIITADEAIKKMEEQQQEQLKIENRKNKGGIKNKFGKHVLPKKELEIGNKKKSKKLKTKVISSDSEQELSEIELDLKDSLSDLNESTTSEESDNEQAQSEKINLLLEHYYTVYYDESWYLAKLVDFYDEDSSKLKFLKKNLEQFYWPPQGKEEIEIVMNNFIFYGPVKLVGSGPFSLKRHEINTIDKKYKTMKKNGVKA